MSNKTLKKGELGSLREINKRNQELYYNIGKLVTTKDQIDEQVSKFYSELKELEEEQEVMFTRIKEEYGEGNINLETGEFTPSK
jgi:septal ring factor EnvC (AmiA/AmiB activator)